VATRRGGRRRGGVRGATRLGSGVDAAGVANCRVLFFSRLLACLGARFYWHCGRFYVMKWTWAPAVWAHGEAVSPHATCSTVAGGGEQYGGPGGGGGAGTCFALQYPARFAVPCVCVYGVILTSSPALLVLVVRQGGVAGAVHNVQTGCTEGSEMAALQVRALTWQYPALFAVPCVCACRAHLLTVSRALLLQDRALGFDRVAEEGSTEGSAVQVRALPYHAVCRLSF
jgi:hypothetical protein